MLTPILAPLLALALATTPRPVERIPDVARIPVVSRIVSIYRGPVQPRLGYGSRPQKHIKIGLSIRF